MKNGKTRGLGRIPVKVIKSWAKIILGILIVKFSACRVVGMFRSNCKVAVIVLLLKGKGGTPDGTSSYRSQCMLNFISKMLENMLRARLKRAIKVSLGIRRRATHVR